MAIRATNLSSFLPVQARTKTRTKTRTFATKQAGSVPLTSSTAKYLIQSGTVRPIPPKEAGEVIQTEGYRLLDIRPIWEWERAHVTGSVHVPLFVDDADNGPITLLKKWVHFGYIGLWTGQLFTKVNEQFVPQVAEVVPNRDEKLLVACGEGLRSLMAVQMLHESGYKNLAWLAGGFSRSVNRNFPQVEGNTKLQYATVGGVSSIFLQLLLILRVLDSES
ncbi:hypothetical protein LUZ63_007512 [Rhynchospora breviuscula]|uniref:Rhodanese domain-containing protein n=1 Tax=Rhynchospora breviuscula TaxID=2022672 RepID=A0A9Q0HV37_9POAL|nr:hypothetical protein LUZ63_007512 [Rhynchospora breviuscula]